MPYDRTAVRAVVDRIIGGVVGYPVIGTGIDGAGRSLEPRLGAANVSVRIEPDQPDPAIVAAPWTSPNCVVHGVVSQGAETSLDIVLLIDDTRRRIGPHEIDSSRTPSPA